MVAVLDIIWPCASIILRNVCDSSRRRDLIIEGRDVTLVAFALGPYVEA